MVIFFFHFLKETSLIGDQDLRIRLRINKWNLKHRAVLALFCKKVKRPVKPSCSASFFSSAIEGTRKQLKGICSAIQ